MRLNWPTLAQVLEWVTRGKTNSDVATILGISRRTVDKFLERIYQKKLGVESRTAAAVRLMEIVKNSQN